MAHEKNTRKKGGVGKILLVLVVLLALAVGLCGNAALKHAGRCCLRTTRSAAMADPARR